MLRTILIRGSGDVGSAVAHALFNVGYSVIIHDSDKPGATRRMMSFCNGFFDGSAVLDAVAAKRIDEVPELVKQLGFHSLIPLTSLDLSNTIVTLHPNVLVDARMRKHDQPEIQITLAPFTIGLGPNFIAGETVHVAIETGWNEQLGDIIWHGATRPLEGEPQTIAGHARDRYVYAPAEGVFRTSLQIGDMVSAGQEVAQVNGISLRAPIDGILRGLTHDSVPVTRKAKVIEVDPRGPQAQISGIPERPRRIAQGVLKAVKTWETNWEHLHPGSK
jgi:xanthine dehydrogenase accessory factor